MNGTITYIKGLPYFQLEYGGQGYFFKDEEAYKNNWFAPCYVAEYHDQCENKGIVIGDEVYDCGGEQKCWYSHMDILQDCHDFWDDLTPEEQQELGFENVYEMCDYVFETVDWQHPSTFINGMDY